MHIALVSVPRVFGSLFLVVLAGSLAYGQLSAQQTVSIEVSPILSLAITSSDGDGVLVYNLTSNIQGAVLEASLNSSKRVVGSIKAETYNGVSKGAVQVVSGDGFIPLVTDIRPGLENNRLITVSVEPDAPPDIHLALTLRDPSTGVTQTVYTRL